MASTEVAAVPQAARRSRSALISFLHREGLVVAVVLAYAASVAWRLPLRLGQDAWFALLGGREVLHHGLPSGDSLTYWTAGRQWVDQQWLGQAGSYSLYSVGGLKLFALTHVLLVTGSLVIACAAARHRGASARAVAWVAVLSVYLLALSAGHVRTQSFAYPLFAVLLFLLLDDRRVPGRRALVALPLLLLWANIHGSVVLGATLTALYGGVLVARRHVPSVLRARGVLLALGGVVAALATPYALDILGYYQSTLFNSEFKTVIAEWRPPTPSLELIPLYALAAAGLWLLGRRHSRFPAFERLALLLLLALTFDSKRNLPWLALAAIPLLAPALDDVLPTPRRAVSTRLNVVASAVAAVFALAALAGAAGRTSYAGDYPAPAAAAVARAAAADPAARIYANEQYADWLLMAEPALRGRIAYDIRFELLDRNQLLSIARWRNRLGDRWKAAASGARIIVLALPSEAQNERALLAEHGTRLLYHGSGISVLLRAKNRSSS
jgi:hypothetical protein